MNKAELIKKIEKLLELTEDTIKFAKGGLGYNEIDDKIKIKLNSLSVLTAQTLVDNYNCGFKAGQDSRDKEIENLAKINNDITNQLFKSLQAKTEGFKKGQESITVDMRKEIIKDIVKSEQKTHKLHVKVVQERHKELMKDERDKIIKILKELSERQNSCICLLTLKEQLGCEE